MFAIRSRERPPYIVNLDPACYEVPYPSNIDIRDTVNYKEVMKQYGLGPNGGIVTSLNLFATKFDQVSSLNKSLVDHHKMKTKQIFKFFGQSIIFPFILKLNLILELCNFRSHLYIVQLVKT